MFEEACLPLMGTGFGSKKSCLFPICYFCLVLMVKDVNSQHPCSCHLLPRFPIRMDSYPSRTIESKQTLPLWLALAVVFYQSNREQIGFFFPSGMGKVILFQIITEMSERANMLNIRTRELCKEKDIHQQDWNREETNLWKSAEISATCANPWFLIIVGLHVCICMCISICTNMYSTLIHMHISLFTLGEVLESWFLIPSPQ